MVTGTDWSDRQRLLIAGSGGGIFTEEVAPGPTAAPDHGCANNQQTQHNCDNDAQIFIFHMPASIAVSDNQSKKAGRASLDAPAGGG